MVPRYESIHLTIALFSSLSPYSTRPGRGGGGGGGEVGVGRGWGGDGGGGGVGGGVAT